MAGGGAGVDLSGCVFGELRVLRPAPEGKGGRRAWVCRCSCGREVSVLGKSLRSGHTRSCGDPVHRRARTLDLRGRVFGWLTALSPTEKRDSKGSVVWLCRCRCGALCEYSAGALLHADVKSCGCYRRTVLPAQMQEAQHGQDGTSVAALKRKRRADNTSGYTGVSRRQNGKWQATIRFKHKFYSLGCYDALSDAVRARKLGEALHDEFLQSYFAEHPEALERFLARIRAGERP